MPLDGSLRSEDGGGSGGLGRMFGGGLGGLPGLIFFDLHKWSVDFTRLCAPFEPLRCLQQNAHVLRWRRLGRLRTHVVKWFGRLAQVDFLVFSLVVA